MSGTKVYQLADRILDGKLADLLAEWRAHGDSFETIAYRLRSEYGLEVSSATVNRWVRGDAAAS